MAAPRYFQTEDEKRMAAIRANPSGRPVQMVRPMRPAGSDSREKWRENVPGGKMIGIDQYKENNRKMYTMEDVPASRPKWENPEQNAGTNGAMSIAGRYGGATAIQSTQRSLARNLGRLSTETDAFTEPFTTSYFPAGGRPSTESDAFDTSPVPYVLPQGGPTAPTRQDIADMEKAGTADMSPRFSPIEMRGSNLNAWQSGSLESPIARKDPYATMLNDRPGGGRTYESPFLKPRPMGSGTLSQRPTSTASGAAERVAYRRAIRMDPKSIEEDRRWARGIGGARNPSYGNYD